jgi:molybdopterin-biosynthesis enzyme MoeA-like protein
MNFGLIIIGDEILSGKRADKHLAKAIEILSERGLSVAYADYVGDDPSRITATLRRAFASGDAVFSFGGIGATPDDHTRQCAAAALGVDLALHPEAKSLILERMQDIAREQGLPYEPERSDNQHRLNMGMFPTGAAIIPNPFNKIPGFSCYKPGRGVQFSDRPPRGKFAPSGGSDPHEVGERGGIHFLPGFPVMAWPMVEWVLDTHYADHFANNAWRERSVIVFGAMEATLTPLMLAIEVEFAVKVFSLPSVDHPEYGRHVELGVKGRPEVVTKAFLAMRQGLTLLQVALGPEIVR